MEVEFESITRAEFEVIAGRGMKAGRSAHPIVMRMRQLAVDEAFKAPCAWESTHQKRGRCHGVSVVADAARRFGYRIKTRCQDGWLHVLRVE